MLRCRSGTPNVDHHTSVLGFEGLDNGLDQRGRRLSAALKVPTTPHRDFIRQRAGRRITRLGFTCVQFRWPGRTSDPSTMQRVVSAFYLDHSSELAASIRLGWGRLTGHPPDTPADQDKPVGYSRVQHLGGQMNTAKSPLRLDETASKPKWTQVDFPARKLRRRRRGCWPNRGRQGGIRRAGASP